MTHKLLTVDVWDTLLRRKCHPDAVKLHVSNYLLNNYFSLVRLEYRDSMRLFRERQAAEATIGTTYLSSGMDDEYNQYEVYQAWLQVVLSDVDNIRPMMTTLASVEVEQEKSIIYADAGIEEFLKSYPSQGRAFVSDFYMSAQVISELLCYAGLGNVVDRGYSSCDHRLNKRSGRLFGLVLEEEKVDPGSTIHVGDNVQSDVKMARGCGIEAVAYLPKAESVLRGLRKEEFENRAASVEKLVIKQPDFATSDCTLSAVSSELYEYGKYCAPLVVGFMLFVMEKSLREGHKKVYFFTREGEFFKKVYDRLSVSQPLGQLAPPSEILEVSRLATFAPSLRSFTLEELMRIWTLYSTQSIAALLKSMNIDVERALIHTSRHEIDVQEEIEFPWLDKKVMSLFGDSSFLDFLTMEVEENKLALLLYLRQKGLSDSTQCAGVVDIGWRGTIQDNLSYLLPECHFDGYYIGLDKFLNNQPDNSSKSAFGPDLNAPNSAHLADLFAAVAPLEMLFNSAFGSTVGYTMVDGYACAERMVNESENNIVESYVVHFQKGVVDSIDGISRTIRENAISSIEIRPVGVKIWSTIIRKPNSAVTHAYFQLNHNEQFGVGEFSDKRDAISSRYWLKALVLPSALRRLTKELESTGWPQGYLYRRNVLVLWSVINRLKIWRNFFRKQNEL